MALKNPSDFFQEGKEESIIDKLVERPELKSFSDAFNVYKENISKFEDLSDTLKNIENIQSDIKDFIKKEDLDNAVVSYAFLLEETVSKLKNDVTGINEKNLISMRSNISNLTEKINNFFKLDVPKYKKSIIESEIKASDRYEKFKNDTDIILEDITKYITNNEEKTEENITSLNKTLDKVVEDLEKKINLISDNKDTIFQNLSKKITEVKNLKKSINKDLKVYEDHKNNVENKISDLEVEIVRSKSNLRENLEKQNKEFLQVKKDIGNNFNNINEEFKTVVDRLNLDKLEEKNIQLSKKVKYLEEIFEKFNEKEFLNEGLINITPESDNSDPLTPLNKDYVTLNQLQEHYRLFLNRIQQQLSTLGGGGETRLQYLDDVVGIATNPAAYDGGYLRYVHSLKKFTFGTPSDGTTWIQGVDGPYTMGRVGIGTSLIQSGTYPDNALVVEGDARITGILTIGTASITLNADTGSISSGEVEVVSAGGGANFTGIITASGADFDGNVTIGGTLTYEDVKNVDSIGIITAGKDVRVGRNFNVTGLSTFTGITTFSDDVYVGGDLNVVGDIVYDEVSGRNLKVTGVSTFGSDKVIVGGATTDLVVNGDARVTGILTIGTSSLTLDGSTNKINVGSATTIETTGYRIGDSFVHSTGISASDVTFKNIVGTALSVSGIATVTDTLKVGTGITANAGIITATTFKGTWQGTALNDAQVGSATTWNAKLDNVVEDTTPELGGDLNGNSKDIYGVGVLTATQIADSNGSVGTASSVLSSTGSGLSWVAQSGGGGGGGISNIGIQSAGTLVGSATTINFTAGNITVANDIANVSVGSSIRFVGVRAYFDTLTPTTTDWEYADQNDFDGITIDTNSFYNSSNGRFVIPAGVSKIRVSTSVNISGGSGGTSVANVWGLYKNGTKLDTEDGGYKVELEAYSGFYDCGVSGQSAAISVVENDYIQMSFHVESTTRTWKGFFEIEVLEGSLLGHYFSSTNVTNADNITVQANNSTDETVYPIFVDGATGAQGPESDTGFTYNPSSGNLTATQLTGTLQTASQTNITALGTIATGTWEGTAVADSYVASAATWNAKQDALTFGIANTNALKIDDADAANNDYAKLTASGIEGRSYTEVKTDLSLDDVENTALSTWAGTSNITSVGVIGVGTWQGTAVADSYVASAATWNAKQDALTFGIANTNALKIDDASVVVGEYTQFTATGVAGVSTATLKSNLSLNAVENTALSTWAGTANVTTLGTIATGTWEGTALNDAQVGSATTWNSKISEVVEDTAPELGGDLDGNSKNIHSVGILTATDFNSTSDIRLKTNIQPIGDPLAKVIQIEGVSFNWKKDNKPALGVIADQIESILPELVQGDDPKTVNYNGLIGLLIEAVKEQQTQIDSLKERISKLE